MRVKSNSNSKWKQVTMSKYSIARKRWEMQEASNCHSVIWHDISTINEAFPKKYQIQSE